MKDEERMTEMVVTEWVGGCGCRCLALVPPLSIHIAHIQDLARTKIIDTPKGDRKRTADCMSTSKRKRK